MTTPRRLVWILVALTALAGVLWPARPAAAQDSSPGRSDLQLERKTRRTIVLPRPVPETFKEDAERATEDLARQRREERLMRETTPGPPRRPDLDHDITGGIQGRNLQRVLPR